jgi:hypothetical protein
VHHRALAATALLLPLLSACYLSSALQRSRDRVAGGWDLESRGAQVVWAGPGMTAWALGELAVGAFRPPQEPLHVWFRTYPGPMRPLEEVAVLCHRDSATNVQSLRDERARVEMPARHQRWHFPECIEALEGRYELRVHYYSRSAREGEKELRSLTAESIRPSVAAWQAEAGGLYLLTAVLGTPRPAPEVPDFFRAAPRPQSPGTTTYDLQVSSWNVRIDRLPGWDSLEVPALAYREAWREYEEALGR